MSSKTKPEGYITDKNKSEDLDVLVNRLLSDPSEIKGLLEAIPNDKGRIRYLYEKAIRTISEK